MNRAPNAAKRFGEAIDLPKGMQEAAMDGFEAADYYMKNGNIGYAYMYSFLATTAYAGSISVDALENIYLGGLSKTKTGLKALEMTVGVGTGERTLGQLGEFLVTDMLLPKIGSEIGKQFISPCKYSTEFCQGLIANWPIGETIGEVLKYSGKGTFWLLNSTISRSALERLYEVGGGGGGRAWGGPPSGPK